MSTGTLRGQRYWISMELELQMVLSCRIRVPGIKPGSSGRARCVLFTSELFSSRHFLNSLHEVKRPALNMGSATRLVARLHEGRAN